MLLFLCFVIITILIVILIISSELRLHVYNFEYSNYKSPNKKNKIKIELYLFGIIKVLSIKLRKERMNNNITKNIIKEKILNIRDNGTKLNLFDKYNIGSITNIIVKVLMSKVELRKFLLNAFIGTDEASLTSILVGILYIIIPNILRTRVKKYNNNKYNVKISPIYDESNKIYIHFECIISIKVVHIINMLKNAKYGKESNSNYERKSNRKLNANCYGKH